MRRLFFVLCALLVAGSAAALWAGHVLTRPARSPAIAPPAELPVRVLSFRSDSGVRLRAWFVAGQPGAGAVLLLHGVRADKRSMTARARVLNEAGFAVLLLDLQAHGESEGDRITFGYREARDVTAAIERLALLAPGERIGVLGVSLGAAAAVLSDARSRYSALALESLYPTIEEAAASRLRMRLGTVGAWLAPLLLWQIEHRLGISRTALRPIDHVGALTAPVLMVHGSVDLHTPLTEAQRIYARIRAPKSAFIVEGAAHVDLHRYAGREFERRLVDFFSTHLRGAPGAR